jgi:16S rRNA (adenine1518-N6/adenine1519-N6)-dimethyltransferase
VSPQPLAPPRARKRFGQHFLEPAWVAKVVAAVNARGDETVLEIGPGRGALTRPLAARVRRLIAVEIDRDLVQRLAADLPANAEVVQADFLDLDVGRLLRDEPKPVRVVGNLPYNVASPILFRLLAVHDGGRCIQDATLMLQREVAERLAAAPGTRDYGALSIQVTLHADVDRLMTLPPGAFRPPPKVTSALVRLRFRRPAADIGDLAAFERLVRAVFLHRRKMLANALKPVTDARGLSAADVLRAAAIDGRRRPETLTLTEMSRLARAVL